MSSSIWDEGSETCCSLPWFSKTQVNKLEIVVFNHAEYVTDGHIFSPFIIEMLRILQKQKRIMGQDITTINGYKHLFTLMGNMKFESNKPNQVYKKLILSGVLYINALKYISFPYAPYSANFCVILIL